MSTSEILALIKNNSVPRGIHTVDIKPGQYSRILGNKVIVYTHGRPDSELLTFSIAEFLAVINSAKDLPINSFEFLIMAKRMFNGEITE